MVKKNLNWAYRKVLFPLALGGIFIFYSWLTYTATRVPLPDLNNPIRFYCNQTRHDIKLLYIHALKKATRSIFLSVYGITDPDILSTLTHQKSLAITVQYDPSASTNLKKVLPLPIRIQPIKSKGLMHRKIVSIDQAQVFLGSANLTSTSLRHHDNFIVGIHHPALASFVENPNANQFSFSLPDQTASLFLLPDATHTGFNQLLDSIRQAKKHIRIAMFTLTHPEITEALIQARQNGVQVTIAVDFFTAKGASKKALDILEKNQIALLKSQGRQLLHHKWAIIDNTTLITGSANWTKAAFSKNQDFLLFLSPLTPSQQKTLDRIWNIIESESQ